MVTIAGGILLALFALVVLGFLLRYAGGIIGLAVVIVSVVVLVGSIVSQLG